jgi:hypothetical protein
MKLGNLLKEYQWNSKELKKKYQMMEYSIYGLLVGILLLLKYVQNHTAYILLILGIIVLLEWTSNKVKKQDKRKGVSETGK